MIDFVGGPGAIRTPDPQIRSLMLYPAELRVRQGSAQIEGVAGSGNPLLWLDGLYFGGPSLMSITRLSGTRIDASVAVQSWRSKRCTR